jgi:hypothetical protein
MLQKCVNHHFGCFAYFFFRTVSEMLQNTINDFGSIGVECMLWLRNDLCNFSGKKYCIQARNTSFASCYFPKVSEMLQNTPNIHFGSNVVEWMFWLRNNICNFGTQNSTFRTETQVLHLFTFRRYRICWKTLSVLILGLVELNGCFGYETIFATSVARNSGFSPETHVLHLFLCWRLAKCFETLPNIILGPMELNGCFASSVPQTSEFRPETQVFHLFMSEC